jgi:hypothetical protein
MKVSLAQSHSKAREQLVDVLVRVPDWKEADHAFFHLRRAPPTETGKTAKKLFLHCLTVLSNCK